jgi:predicted permease
MVDWLLRRDRAEQRLDDELHAYLEISAAEKMRDGLPAGEARRLARLELGGLEQAKERVRTYRHGGGLDEMGRDIRYAFRLFRKTPGFTIVVVLTLALGIGANTAIFSLIDALMLRWLPVKNPQELVQVSLQPRDAADPPNASLSYPIVRALADQREIFSGAAGFSRFQFEVGSAGSLTRVPGAMVTGAFYETLGLNPVIGRLLTREDDRPGMPMVAVISHGYWERQLARSPDVVGHVLRINQVPVTIVGVSPRGFVGATVGAAADITMPVAALPQVSPSWAPLLGPGNFWLRVLARPQPGISRQGAETRLDAMWRGMSDALIAPHWPATRRRAMADSVFRLSDGGTGWTHLRAIYRKPLLLLMAVVGLVLLIACANVAGLQLARASARRREMAVRLAIGASRSRIVRQLLIESMVLSGVGAACGVGLAWLSSRFLIDLISTTPSEIVFDLNPNVQVLAFTALVALAAGVTFGIAPAFHATAAAPSGALKEDSRTSGRRSRLRLWLVTAQVAISLVLLAGAALFVRTLQNLQNLDPGFSAEGVLLAEMDGRRPALPQELVDDLRHLSGVMAVALTTHTPLSGSSWSEPVVPAGQPIPDRDNARLVGAGAGFFETMQMPLLAGREFTASDTEARPRVAIVDEAFARLHFQGVNPVGRHLAARLNGERTDLEVIGLARDTHWTDLRSAPYPTVYVAYTQVPGEVFSTIALRARGGMGALSSTVQRLLESKVPGVYFSVHPLSRQLQATLVQERMMATLAVAFGLLALTLVCVGLYGLLAYSVAQRTKEIGIRIALGARVSWVVGLVLRDAARLVAIGVAVGLPAAWIASRWTKSMLFGVTPTDPASIGAALAALTAAALLASYLPARRASRLNPLVALRHE